MPAKTTDIHAHILSEETIRLLQREAPKIAPKLSQIDDQFGILDVAGGGDRAIRANVGDFRITCQIVKP